jgi:two-component system, OmpR family, sensor histidine kinase MtrB
MAQRRRRLGLRARVTLAFAVGALLLSSSVAASTFALTRNQLLSQLESNAVDQVWRNAREIRAALRNPDADVTSVLDQLYTPNEARVLLELSDGQIRSPSALTPRDIPADLRASVVTEGTGLVRYVQNSQPRLAIGVTIGELGAEYFEVAPLDELDETLRTLAVILTGTALATSLVGAVFGYLSARTALRPLQDVSAAAGSIASGDLGIRIDPDSDPDLSAITTSFNEMAEALQARIERDERFASDVSHELRSPLMTLAASISVLEGRRDEMPEVAQQALDLLVADIERFRRLVEDLLEISRFDAGAARLEVSWIQLSEFLSRVIAGSRTPAVPLVVSPRHAELTIRADKRRLAQVVTNLLDNADKYAGGATAVSFRPIGDHVHIVVDDEGPGVSSDDKERIFDRFSRGGADAGRRQAATGVGLGLSLVAEHVRLHGGRVWVMDQLDGRSGSRFVVELPRNLPGVDDDDDHEHEDDHHHEEAAL